MKRQELCVGRVGEYEFQFWECWESDPHNPQAPERHWFRAPNGMEASTSEEMLDKLCGRFVARPSTQPSAPTPWDRRTSRQVRIKDKGQDKDVLIDTIEHYTCENGTLTGVTVRGPNGLVTSTYEEMLELLGIAPERPLSAGSKLSAKAEQQLSPVTSQVSQEREPPTVEPEFTVSQDGKLVANRATEEPCFRWGQ